MLGYFILDDDRRPVPAGFQEYKAWLIAQSSPLDGMPKVATSVVSTADGSIEVSTIFLGHDLSPPHAAEREFFETRIGFAGGADSLELRWPTWDQAENGHREILRLLSTGDASKARLAGLLRHIEGGAQ